MVAKLYVRGHKEQLKVISFDLTVCLPCKILLLLVISRKQYFQWICTVFSNLAAFSKAR